MTDEINKGHKIAEVVWHDLSDDSKEISSHEVIEFLPILKQSIGYVVSTDNDECLILSTEVIPWSSIIEWQEFEVH